MRSPTVRGGESNHGSLFPGVSTTARCFERAIRMCLLHSRRNCASLGVYRFIPETVHDTRLALKKLPDELSSRPHPWEHTLSLSQSSCLPRRSAQREDGPPNHLAVDSSTNVYIADTMNHRIRRIDAAGIIHTIAGTGTGGFSGDGGAATNAQKSSLCRRATVSESQVSNDRYQQMGADTLRGRRAFRRLGCFGLRSGLDDHRPVPFDVSMGTLSKTQGRGQDAHVAESARQHTGTPGNGIAEPVSTDTPHAGPRASVNRAAPRWPCTKAAQRPRTSDRQSAPQRFIL